MVEKIKEFRTELRAKSVTESECFAHGEIHILNARGTPQVALCGSRASERWRSQHGVAHHVAAEAIERSRRQGQLISGKMRIVSSHALAKSSGGIGICEVRHAAGSAIGIGETVNRREVRGVAIEIPRLSFTAGLIADRFTRAAEVV